MPGPKATNRKRREAAPNSPNAKTKARMSRRLEAFKEPSTGDRSAGLWRHKPGSQNRKKS